AGLAAALQAELADRPIRAAVVAAPMDAERRFGKVMAMLGSGVRAVLDIADGVFIGSATTAPRIGFLFPDDVGDGDPVTAAVAGLRVLDALGIEGVVAAGHGLGEFTALHWAGGMDEITLLRIAAARRRIMDAASDGDGMMASIGAEPELVEPMLAGENVVIAGYNSPQQTVVSGRVSAVELVCAKAIECGLTAVKINMPHALHSEHMAMAAEQLRAHLDREHFTPLARRMVSTVTADTLPADIDVPSLLARQVLAPVRFTEAVERLASDVDLILEVGPGATLCRLAADIAPFAPAISLDADSTSLSGLLAAVGAAYALGAPVRHEALFTDRGTRPTADDIHKRAA
ncbi:MAG TPA: acyltransferase domain-containing protein, partial [Pseudonocardiaceae bacterium]